MDFVDTILAQWHKERPELEVGPMATLGRLKRLNQHLMRGMEQTFAAYGLTAGGFDVLATLRRSGPPHALSPGSLMASTMVTSGTMTHRVDQLKKAGLIERVRNPEDGRGYLICLSAKGHSLIDAAVTAHVETQAQLIAALTNEQCAQLDELLRQFLQGFERS